MVVVVVIVVVVVVAAAADVAVAGGTTALLRQRFSDRRCAAGAQHVGIQGSAECAALAQRLAVESGRQFGRQKV